MGQLSRLDIENENLSGGLQIIPYRAEYKKAASYDITPSIIAMSVKVGMLENVYREPGYNGDCYYIFVHAKDTVLIVSNEYLIIPKNIAGYVSSRVSKLVEGFGHISTTIDPNWRGAGLIALSNPSNHPLKVYVGNCSKNDNRQNQLATVTFHYLNTACNEDDIDGVHRGMRLDLLEKVIYKKKSGIRAGLRNLFYYRRRRFTDYFFSACDSRYQNLDENMWKEFLKEFSYLEEFSDGVADKKLSKKAKYRAVDFVITENVLTRTMYFLQKRKGIVSFCCFFILILLIQLGIIPETWFEAVINMLASLLTVSR